MAIITQYRTWNGIQTKQEVNTETGVIEVFAINSGLFGIDEKITRSDGKGNDWEITNPTILKNEYNKVNKTRLTESEVKRKFYIKDYKILNDDRAAVLNNAENFPSLPDYATANQRFFDQKTPGVTNPNNGQSVSPTTGEVTKLQVEPFVESGDQTETGAENVESRSATAGQVITGGASDEGSTAEDSKSIPTPTPKPKVENLGYLRYPLANLEVVDDITGITYDYIKITIKDWTNSIGSTNVVNNSGTVNSKDAVSRYKQTKSNLKTIILPMTNSITSTNGVGWGQNNANSIQLALAGSINGFLNGVGEGDGLNFDTIKKFGSELIESSGNIINNIVKNNNAVASLLAGYVVGNTSIATRASGMVINPNMELLFNGPKLRTFNFQFEFAPRFKGEADQVRKIIREFKRHSAPVIETTGNIFLKTPKIFQLEYIYNGDGSDTADGSTHPYLNKIKPCALVNVGVNYTPGNTYMTYADGGSMVQTTLTLSFNELEPIYDIDYKDGHPTGY